MTVAEEMYMRKIICFVCLIGFGYVGYSEAWWNTEQGLDRHCPSEDTETHECYELTEETRMCFSYGFECCYGGSQAVICGLCLKGEYRPCTLYKCTHRGCCKGWSEDEFGRCSIPTGSEIVCENGGVLYKNNSTCRCTENFTGDRCEIPICEYSCQNGGNCELVDGEPKCICPSSYFSGNFCEIVTCTEECLHGGQCIEDGVIARCQCKYGYRGRACEVLTSNLCPINPDDLKNSDCTDAIHECYSDDGCQDNKVCCWNGCSGECKIPDDVKCYDDNRAFSVGDIYRPHVCSVCVCQPMGRMKCEQVNCTDQSCPGGHQPVSIGGQCCKRCPGNDTTHVPEEPHFINCPSHIVEANVRKKSDIAILPELNLIAKDFEDVVLSVYYSETQFRHSRSSDIYKNTHIVMAYSYTDRNGLMAECSFKVIVKDKYAPVFSSCPVEIWAKDDETVTWVPPVPTDNVGISQVLVEGDLLRNRKLSHGTYPISYTALDFDQNKAICAFSIHVYEQETDWSRVPADPIYEYYYNGVPTGTIIGISTGTVIMVFFTIWMCVRIRQNRQAEAAERAAETNTIASTADSGPNSTIYAMCGRVAQMYSGGGSQPNAFKLPKDIKLPAYSPPMNPPSYDELGEAELGHSLPTCPPIYEEIPEHGERNFLHPKYENMASGIENPTYCNILGDAGDNSDKALEGQNNDKSK